jgi:oxygen-independent coproporphyrinogen-3 oxidase
MEEFTFNKQEPVGLYIHIPFCARKCNYCDFPSFSGLELLFSEYTEAVCREIAIVSKEYGYPEADTVFFGGGTPSLMPTSEISKIVKTIYKSFKVKDDTEITIEANPGTITKEKAEVYKDLGFNRISVGLQAAQDRILKLMGRIHTKEMFIDCINLLKSIGISNINADIIFGIPCQSVKDWEETINLLLAFDLPHLSCYSLKIEENTPWFEMSQRGELPEVDEDLEREMYYVVMSKLNNLGYQHYEISNFSKPGFWCRHNLKYWTGKPYIGIGAAAHSFINNVRYANIINPEDYIKRVMDNASPVVFREEIGERERLSERLILGLRLMEGISLKQMEREFGHEAVGKYSKKIENLEEKKLICFNGDIIKLTKKGMDFANQVWVEFI